jgi:hypothetical protein
MKKILTLIGILGVLTVIYITTRFDDCLARAGMGGTGRSEGARVGP